MSFSENHANSMSWKIAWVLLK